MYGTIKAHKPEKQYPMRIVVSTIGTANYGVSDYIVKIAQNTLNKNETRIKNSQSFMEEAKTSDKMRFKRHRMLSIYTLPYQ